MHRTIPKENTHLGAELEFMRIILMQTRPASTPKNTKERVVWWNLKKAMNRCILVEHRSRHTVNKITRREKSLIRKPQRERRMGKKSEARLDQMTVFALGNPVLLRSVGAGHSMRNAGTLKIAMQLVVLTTPI